MSTYFQITLDSFSAPSDGTLPDVVITFRDPSEAQAAARYILDEQEKEHADVPGHRIEKFPRAFFGQSAKDGGPVVRDDQIFILRDFKGMPRIGFRLFYESMYLHFETGPDWTRQCVETFVALFRKFVEDFGAKVELDPEEETFGEREVEAFAEVVAVGGERDPQRPASPGAGDDDAAASPGAGDDGAAASPGAGDDGHSSCPGAGESAPLGIWRATERPSGGRDPQRPASLGAGDDGAAASLGARDDEGEGVAEPRRGMPLRQKCGVTLGKARS